MSAENEGKIASGGIRQLSEVYYYLVNNGILSIIFPGIFASAFSVNFFVKLLKFIYLVASNARKSAAGQQDIA